MNGLFVPEHILRRRDLDPGEKLLLALIEFRMGEKGRCWWPHGKLAPDVGMTKSTVQRTAARLVEKRVLVARLDTSRRLIVYERSFPQAASFPQVDDPPAGRLTHVGESIDSPGELYKKNLLKNSSEEKENSSAEQSELPFGPLAKPAAIETGGLQRNVAECGCGFRGRPVWEDQAGAVVALGDCPRCHRVGYNLAALAEAVNG